MGLVSDIRARFTASADGFNKTVQGVKSQTQGLEGVTDRTSSRVAAGWGAMTKSVAKFAGAYLAIKGTTEGLGGLAKSTIGANMQMEQYEVTLGTVLKSQEKATEYLEWANKFAATTPFEIPQIVDATAKLETYGINAKDTLGSIGNMAAIMGKPLDQAVEAVADAQTGELERLKEFGITKQMLIDKAQDMYGEEIVNAQGQITDMEKLNGALFAIMDDRYEGGMDKMSKTAAGMISNVKDNLGTIAREMSKPLFEKFKAGLSSILPVLDSVTSFIRGDAAGAADTLVEAFGQDKADMIMKVFNGIKTGAGAVKQFFIDMKPTLDNVMQIFVNLSPLAKAMGTALSAAFLGVMKVLPPILEGLTGIVKAFTGWEGFLPLVTGLASGFVALKAGLAVAAGISKVASVVTMLANPISRAIALAKAWKNIQLVLNATLLANPIVAVIAAIVAIGAALVVAYKKSETFRNFVNKLWDGLKAGWDAVANFFTTTIPAWFETLKGWFSTGWDAVKQVWENFKTAFILGVTGFINGVKMSFTNGWNAVKTVFSTVFGWIKTAITTSIAGWKLAFDTFMAALKAIWDKLSLVIMPVINNFITMVQTLWTNFVTTVQGIITPIIDFFIQTWENIKLFVLGIVGVLTSGIVGDWEGVKLGLIAIGTAIWNQLKNIFTTIKEVLTALWTGLVNALKAAWTALKNTVLQVGKVLWDGIKKAFDSGKKWLVNIWKVLKDTLSKAWTALKVAVINTAKALWNGVKSTFNSLKSGVSSIFNSVKSAASSAWNAIKSAVINAAKGLWNGVKSAFNSMKSGVQSIINSVKSFISGGWKDAARAAAQSALDMYNRIRSALDNVINKVKNIVNNIKSTFKNLNLAQIGRDIMNGLLRGITNGATAVWNKAKSIADGIKNKIKGALKIASPSKVMTEYGQFTGEGLMVGMENMRKKVQKTAANLAGRIRTGTSSVIDGAMSAKASINSVMSLQHMFDLKNVPSHIDINTLVSMLAKATNNPTLQRAIDQIQAKNRLIKKKPRGGFE